MVCGCNVELPWEWHFKFYWINYEWGSSRFGYYWLKELKHSSCVSLLFLLSWRWIYRPSRERCGEKERLFYWLEVKGKEFWLKSIHVYFVFYVLILFHRFLFIFCSFYIYFFFLLLFIFVFFLQYYTHHFIIYHYLILVYCIFFILYK
jgi:hypothetical protein